MLFSKNFVKFLRKFFLFILAIAVIVILQLYGKEFGRFEFTICERIFSVGVYVMCLVTILIYFILFVIKSFFNWMYSVFRYNEIAETEKSVRGLAKLIVSNEHDFARLYEKTAVIDSLQALKIALALKRKFGKDKHFEKTGIPCIDIYVFGRRLQRLLDAGEVKASVTLATYITQNYAEHVEIIKEELLEVAISSKRNNIEFIFNPSRFKYNLPPKYIEEYDIRLKLLEFEMSDDIIKKFEMLQKLHKEYVDRVDILLLLLDFFTEYMEAKGTPDDMKWVLKVIKETISVNPNRNVVKYLLRSGRNDVFELAQSMMSNVPEDNVEKNWILLKLAIAKNFNLQAKELAKRLIKARELNNMFEFISSEPEVVKILREMKGDIAL